jgi:hypothetical protein
MHEEEHARLHSSRANLVCALTSCARILSGTHRELCVAILPRALGANVRERNVPVTKAQRHAEACNN